MKKPFLLLLTGFIIQSASSQKSLWTYQDRTDFMTNCVEAANAIGRDSAKFYCYCMMDKLEKKYPDPAVLSESPDIDLESPEWKKVIQGCLGQNWPNEYRKGFLASCVETAKANLGENEARNYCECMMFKLELRYPNYEDADNISSETLSSPEFQELIRSCLKPKEK